MQIPHFTKDDIVANSDASMAWLDSLRQIAVQPPAGPSKSKAKSRIVCVLVPGGASLDLLLCRSRQREDGGYTNASIISSSYDLPRDAASVPAPERALIRLFLALRPDGNDYTIVAGRVKRWEPG